MEKNKKKKHTKVQAVFYGEMRETRSLIRKNVATKNDERNKIGNIYNK